MSKNEELKKNVATGASSAVGAAVGVVAGAAMASQEASAETVDELEVQEIAESEDPETEISNPQNEEQVIEAQIEPDEMEIVEIESQASDNLVEVEMTVEPSIEVIESGPVDFGDGHIGQAALLNVEGTLVGLVDVDNDGIADFALVDENHDGILQENEIHDASGADITMPTVEDGLAGQGDLYAANDDASDFVNDADAGMYTA